MKSVYSIGQARKPKKINEVDNIQKYCNRFRVTAYVTEETFERIENKRQKTQESQSGIIVRALDAYFIGDNNGRIRT